MCNKTNTKIITNLSIQLIISNNLIQKMECQQILLIPTTKLTSYIIT